MKKVKLKVDDSPEHESIIAAGVKLWAEMKGLDLVSRQKVLEHAVAVHACRSGGSKKNAVFVADAIYKHVRQLIDIVYEDIDPDFHWEKGRSRAPSTRVILTWKGEE